MFELSYICADKSIFFTKVSLKNELEITFSNLGASIFEISFSDNKNNMENILVSPTKKFWLKNRTFAGGIIGPLAGRYEPGDTNLEENRPSIHFHGGSDGWDKLVWEQSVAKDEEKVVVTFSHFSLNYTALVIYTIANDCTLKMEISVQPQRKIFCNPTNHMYFNLNGSAFAPITNHLFQLDSDAVFLEESGLIQSHTPSEAPEHLNFQNLKPLSALSEIGGINSTFQFNKRFGILQHPTNGRRISFETTLPSVVVYTFNVRQDFFSSAQETFPLYSGITFETQYPANNLDSVTFDPARPYYSKTAYKFSHY